MKASASSRLLPFIPPAAAIILLIISTFSCAAPVKAVRPVPAVLHEAQPTDDFSLISTSRKISPAWVGVGPSPDEHYLMVAESSVSFESPLTARGEAVRKAVEQQIRDRVGRTPVKCVLRTIRRGPETLLEIFVMVKFGGEVVVLHEMRLLETYYEIWERQNSRAYICWVLVGWNKKELHGLLRTHSI